MLRAGPDAFTELCDLLVAGGYFRARITGLSPFDKPKPCMDLSHTQTQYRGGGRITDIESRPSKSRKCEIPIPSSDGQGK